MGVVRNIVNDQLLMLSYKDPKNIRNFLRNWGGLESLSLRGDRVATCILADLKTVTGIDPEKYDRHNRKEFILGYSKGKLSYLQYISIAFVLILGYSQPEVAYVFGVSHQAISKAIITGTAKIQEELKNMLEEE